MVKQIAKTGCNVLLVQKSILRDAVTDLSLDFCAKASRLTSRREAPNQFFMHKFDATRRNQKWSYQGQDMLTVFPVFRTQRHNGDHFNIFNRELLRQKISGISRAERVTMKHLQAVQAKIMVVKDIEREDIEFISKILGVEAPALEFHRFQQ